MGSNLIPSLVSIKARAIHGSIWSVLGFGSAQFVRLLSNLLLTRLLFPEVFGVMALVMVVLQGIKMFSDIGISTSVVRDERGDNPDYLNTAWTLQTMRGVAIWAISCALAYPASNLYEAPQLLALIPVIGLTAVIQGFNAPGILSLKRHMKVRQLISWEFTTQLVTVVSDSSVGMAVQVYLGDCCWRSIGGANWVFFILYYDPIKKTPFFIGA